MKKIICKSPRSYELGHSNKYFLSPSRKTAFNISSARLRSGTLADTEIQPKYYRNTKILP